MSIINNAHAGSNIESLFLLDKRIIEFSQKKPGQRISDEDLLAPCMPEFLFRKSELNEQNDFIIEENPQKKLRETFRFWSEEGFWDKNDEGTKAHSIFDNTKELPSRLIRFIASKEYDVLSGMKIEPFIRLMALFLSIDEATFVGKQFLDKDSAYELVIKLFSREDEQGRMVYNSNESGRVFAYAHLLGFFETVGGGRFAVDPTRVVEVFLDDTFKQDDSLYFDEFLLRLNKCFPIFDHGEYRVQVEQQLIRPSTEWSPEKINRLSASLSIALYRLNAKRKIYYDLGSDSKVRFKLTLPGSEEVVISNIRYVREDS
jgi:hypothetical protein